MRKVWIIVLLCNFEFMVQAMDRLTMERCLKNSLIKNDVIIRRSASEGDFIGSQWLYTQNLIDYTIENLPNNKVDEIVDEFEEEKKLVKELWEH
jgi:hypothetical protein